MAHLADTLGLACALSLTTLASILATPLAGIGPASAACPTVRLAIATMASTIAAAVVQRRTAFQPADLATRKPAE